MKIAQVAPLFESVGTGSVSCNSVFFYIYL